MTLRALRLQVEHSFDDCWRIDLEALEEVIERHIRNEFVHPVQGGAAATAPAAAAAATTVGSQGGPWPYPSGVVEAPDAELLAQQRRAAVVLAPSVLWERLPHRGEAPPPRIGHAAVAVGNRLILCGFPRTPHFLPVLNSALLVRRASSWC